MSDSRELLKTYAENGSEEAFREVVSRYVNLVYSTAARLVNGDSHLAEDVTQRVFTDLAKMAGSLSNDVMLGGWLHRHTCFLAKKAIRTDLRRREREEKAAKMNEPDQSSAPEVPALGALDRAINDLGAKDRQAILLRYFEERDFRSVGTVLGSTEEGARKRVSRALEKLRVILEGRGVTLSTASLAAVLEAQAIAAAPAGIAAGIAASAIVGASAGGGTALTTLYFMSMTKVQTGVIAVITLGLAIPIVLQQRVQAKLRGENTQLRQRVEQVEVLSEENARLSNLLAKASAPAPKAQGNEEFRELMRLRGEVGVLKKDANAAAAVIEAGKQSPLSAITSNPEMTRMIRDQQKMGMSMIYKDFAKGVNLPTEKTEELNNLLADEVMVNIDHIVAGLRDGKNAAEMDEVFKRQEAATEEKVRKLIGDEAFAKYEKYNQDLVSTITAEQFKGMMLKGDKSTKEAQGRQLFELLQQEKQRALSAAGLPEDYQLVPSLNFRNFAFEDVGEKNLMLLDSVYEQVQQQAGSFLSPEEVDKFGEFRKMAINNNRVALAVNRKLMAPAAAK